MVPFPRPSVRVALHSPALAAGIASLLRGAGLRVTDGDEADVLVVDDPWLHDPEALAAELEGAAGVVALGARAWVGVLHGVAPGGWAVLGTDATPAELLAGVLAAAAGLAALAPGDVWAADEEPGGDPGPAPVGVSLTPRERDVLALLAAGLSNKRAARDLGVSESTVKFHVQAVYSKLGVQSRAGAVARGVQLGLISV
ncbi:helix-turn-helix transcriptional regulator [Deinococcus budaensis]|uniref:DNA-binding NarL/FixJ family response regulator n=1 Tax=Deinococcus budaensis TaxID=1665626 RepID=A0A7W8GE03_9DEIO|nr:response regulator transcription factor [Deinococcus budaensis]MBB5233521.1 DNA-binding NarL/FixJ family response regulator [Deinococcus budaensis]